MVVKSAVALENWRLKMSRDEFFNRLWNMVKDSDVEYHELLDDDGEGGIYLQFKNVTVEVEDE